MHVRRIVPSDRENYRSILDDTTAEDRYCRFFHAVDHFEPSFIDQYVDDRPGVIGFIAFDGEPLGAAHAIAVDQKRAELAVIVARRGRRRGIARALLERVAQDAAQHGYEWLVGYALRENAAFSALAKAMDMKPDPMSDGLTVTWRLRLADRDYATRSPAAAR